MSLSLLFTYPHVSYVVRQVTHDIFWPMEEITPFRLYALTAAVVISTGFVAIVYPDLRSIFSIAGSTCGVANYYFFPCMFYMKTLPPGGWFEGPRRGPALLMTVGLLTGAVSLVTEILETSGVI